APIGHTGINEDVGSPASLLWPGLGVPPYRCCIWLQTVAICELSLPLKGEMRTTGYVTPGTRGSATGESVGIGDHRPADNEAFQAPPRGCPAGGARQRLADLLRERLGPGPGPRRCGDGRGDRSD